MSEDLLEFKKDMISANSSLSVGYINVVMVILFTIFCFIFYFDGFVNISFYVFMYFSYKWKVMFNPNKAGLFEGSFSWGGEGLTLPSFTCQEELIWYQYNFIQLLNNLFRVCWKWKNADIICYKLTSSVSLQKGNVKTSKTLRKIDENS